MAGNFGELLQKASKEGLSSLEVNQLARHYGIDFGDKAFNKLGDPLSSVSAQMFENVRKGLKEVARRGVTGPEAKALDSLIGDSIAVRNLVRKNIEAVNRLEQKASKMGIGEKIVRGASKVADVATLGGFSGFRKLFIQSNVGLKTMNYLDIESHLAGNLKILQNALKEANPGKFEALIKKFNRSMIEKAKSVRPGMSIQDISPRGAEARRKLAELTKKMGEAKTKTLRNRYKKAVQDLIDRENGVSKKGSPAMGKIAQSEDPLLQEAGKYKSAQVEANDYAKKLGEKYNGRFGEMTGEESATLSKLNSEVDRLAPKKAPKTPSLPGKNTGTSEDIITGTEYFHATTPDRLDSIIKDGLSISQKARGVNGGGQVFVADTPRHALGFMNDLKLEGAISEGTSPILLRVRDLPHEKLTQDVIGRHNSLSSGTAWSYSDNVPAKYLEIKKDGKWIPLTDLYNKAQGVKKKIKKNKAQLEALRKLKKKD